MRIIYDKINESGRNRIVSNIGDDEKESGGGAPTKALERQ